MSLGITTCRAVLAGKEKEWVIFDWHPEDGTLLHVVSHSTGRVSGGGHTRKGQACRVPGYLPAKKFSTQLSVQLRLAGAMGTADKV